MGDESILSRLLKGRATAGSDLAVHLSDRDGPALSHKMRQAYWWITNNAVLCPYYDIQFGEASKVKNAAGDELALHDAMSYSSFVLLPLLTLFTRRRALFVGGPGRGKTTSAILMALLSGMSKDDVRRSIQRGHPQLTIGDLLGSPVPSDMLKADDLSAVKISWRKWIGSRVKIIDEYNRIPTKTQSALLSLMAEGYAEMFDQYVYAGRSSWFLTANDDAGGGTFQVIEALKDRIDIVVRAVPFNSGFLEPLLKRIEADRLPEDMLPSEILFQDAELEQIYAEILAVTVPVDVLDRISFFLGQLDFCRMASPEMELKHKDTLRLGGKTVGAVCDERCPLDKQSHLCTQTESGVSARTYQTCLHFVKALAYFRSHVDVELEDVRQLAPWILHDKLIPTGGAVLRGERDATSCSRIASRGSGTSSTWPWRSTRRTSPRGARCAGSGRARQGLRASTETVERRISFKITGLHRRAHEEERALGADLQALIQCKAMRSRQQLPRVASSERRLDREAPHRRDRGRALRARRAPLRTMGSGDVGGDRVRPRTEAGLAASVRRGRGRCSAPTSSSCARAWARGYVYPATAGCDTFFNHAFTRLVPELLPSVPGGERAAALAACRHNLGENLEAQPAWLRRIFARRRARSDLARLEDFVADVTRLAVDPPPRILDSDASQIRLTRWPPRTPASSGRDALPRAGRALRPRQAPHRAGSIRAVTLAAWLGIHRCPTGTRWAATSISLNDGSAATRRRLYVAAARGPPDHGTSLPSSRTSGGRRAPRHVPADRGARPGMSFSRR
ncbi:MAG: MoxR family ATPase [Acidobacteriota bacterium]